MGALPMGDLGLQTMGDLPVGDLKLQAGSTGWVEDTMAGVWRTLHATAVANTRVSADKCSDPNNPDRMREWLEQRADLIARLRTMIRADMAGDPDGALEPLPVKAKPKRVIPDVPATTYAAMLRGLV